LQWRKACERANDWDRESSRRLKTEKKADRQRIHRLKRELRRKEKALAETAALLVLHSDNGSPQKGSTLNVKLESLGIMASFSRPRVSNDNPYSEALFQTCKYRPGYPRSGFETIEDSRRWVNQFVLWYNDIHLHSAIRFVTPESTASGGRSDAETEEGRDV